MIGYNRNAQLEWYKRHLHDKENGGTRTSPFINLLMRINNKMGYLLAPKVTSV